MKKITVGVVSMAAIIVALNAYGFPELAQNLHDQWETAPIVDPASDGPEVGILRTKLLTL